MGSVSKVGFNDYFFMFFSPLFLTPYNQKVDMKVFPQTPANILFYLFVYIFGLKGAVLHDFWIPISISDDLCCYYQASQFHWKVILTFEVTKFDTLFLEFDNLLSRDKKHRFISYLITLCQSYQFCGGDIYIWWLRGEKADFLRILRTGTPIPVPFLPTTFFRLEGSVSQVFWLSDRRFA